jgi:hypothetical protein
LLVLLLAVSPLAAWPTKSASETETIPTGLQIIPVADPAESVVLSPVKESFKPSPSQDTTSPKPSEKTSTMQSQELSDLLAFLRSEDSSDLVDLTELRATFTEIKALIDIQKAAQKDMEEQYLADLKAKDDRIAELKADYSSLSSQYDKVVLALSTEQDKKQIKQYRASLGASMLYDSETGEKGYAADIGVRVVGPVSITGGASYFPDKGFEGLTYKAGLSISF